MTGDPVRRTSFGQSADGTLVDRFGVWLSARQVRRLAGSFSGKDVGDFGCGFEATLVRSLLPEVSSATVVDVALAPDLLDHPKVVAHVGAMPEVLRKVPSESLDIALCMSVVEHLWNPQESLDELHRVLRPGGRCLVNVPSWAGKRALEFSAFRLGLSPTEEMDDHKLYYDPRDLWPLVVRAGFQPHAIRCFRHKFGLNTFAVATKTGTDAS